jgi:acetoacetate decarboxylase
MPGHTPLYSRLPQYFPDSEVLQVVYETDPEAIADIVPEDLEVPEPAEAMVTFFKFPFSTLGPYNEFALDVKVKLDGQDKYFTAYNYVNSDTGLAAGREIWGVPKKFAHVNIEKNYDLVVGSLERPAGYRLITAIIRPEQPASLQPSTVTRMCLKIIPSAGDNGKPVVQLVDRYRHRLAAKVAWSGPCSLHFNEPSELDPVHRIKPNRILRCVYGTFDYVLDFGRVVRDYSG